jgi:hypothetical protein
MILGLGPDACTLLGAARQLSCGRIAEAICPSFGRSRPARRRRIAAITPGGRAWHGALCCSLEPVGVPCRR